MNQTAVKVLYGKSALTVRIPERNLNRVLLLPETGAPDEMSVIRSALQNPIESLTLEQLSKDAKSIVIIADDITRPMPSKKTISEIIAHLSEPHKKDITILIANGLHRPMTAAEIEERFGELAIKYSIVNHDANDALSLADFGMLFGGNRLYLNSLAQDCDLLIAEGFIEPHFFAGFSGGRKSILPGIAGKQTIMHNHSPKNILNTHSCMGSMEKNPINSDCEEACARSGLSFILNVTLDRNKKVNAAFAGHPLYAHKRGCEYVKRLATVQTAPADIVITSNSGYPLDMNLYQAVKGMVAAAAAAKKGGVIIIAAELGEGVGHGYFKDIIASCRSIEELWQKCKSDEPAVDKWQVQEYAKVLIDHTVILVSGGITKQEAESLFLMHSDDLDKALEIAFSIKGREATVNVIPEGPVILPSVNGFTYDKEI